VYASGRCYKLDNAVAGSWDVMQKRCKEVGATCNLASFITKEEMRWAVFAAVHSHPEANAPNWFPQFWIGYRKTEDDERRWVDGRNGTFEYWSENEPTNGPSEKCVQLFSSMYWDDFACAEPRYGLCSCDARGSPPVAHRSVPVAGANVDSDWAGLRPDVEAQNATCPYMEAQKTTSPYVQALNAACPDVEPQNTSCTDVEAQNAMCAACQVPGLTSVTDSSDPNILRVEFLVHRDTVMTMITVVALATAVVLQVLLCLRAPQGITRRISLLIVTRHRSLWLPLLSVAYHPVGCG
jgi:hypothetical protein